MKKIIYTLLFSSMAFAMNACSSQTTQAQETASVPVVEETSPEQNGNYAADSASDKENSDMKAEEPQTKSDKLVVYFSRTGEQYGVGSIEKGNTAIAAEIIAARTGADMYEIVPENDIYPKDNYKKLTEVAKDEKNVGARPAIKNALPEMTHYQTVFFGGPCWWGDWPMIMYTFFEKAELAGKKLVPFSTQEGSGLSGFDTKLAKVCPKSTVLKGLAITGSDCQKNRAEVEKDISSWLKEIGY